MTLLLAGLALIGVTSPASAVGGTPITSAGPLTEILVGDDTQCQVQYDGDLVPSFYGDVDSGACATLVAVGGTLYGPEVIDAGGGASPRTTFTPVSQSSVTGAGTPTDPYRLTTVMDLGATGLRLTETDTYIEGQEAYLTTVTLANTGNTAQTATIYRAGDCYLQDSDDGFGQVDGAAVACRSTVSERIIQWYPLTSGSTYMEGYYDDVWQHIGTQQPFENTCRCGTDPSDEHDNAAGLSWQRTIAAGATVSVSHYTTFSPLGIQPLTVTKTAADAQVEAGGQTSYTISIANPSNSEVSLTSVIDDLPDGFTYVDGSTTGDVTADPSVSGQTLTWEGPIPIGATDTLTFTFSVTVSDVPGVYTNTATATGEGLVIVGADQVAPVEVVAPSPTSTTAPDTTPTTAAPSPIAARPQPFTPAYTG